MSKKHKKQKAPTNYRRDKKEQKRLSSLADLAGTIIEGEKESKFTGNLEDLSKEDLKAEAHRLVDLPEPKPAFDPNSLINGIIKDHKE